MTKHDLIKLVAEKLKNAGIQSADFEARQLTLDIKELNNEALKTVEMRLNRRLNHEPSQYILGEWEFYGLPFKVGEGVLIPRPDTETLVEAALPILRSKIKPTVLDLCAGSGCIGIALAKQLTATVIFLEKSKKAIKYLNENLVLNGVKAEVMECDILNMPKLDFKADMLVSNPPYIKTKVIDELEPEVKREPKMALDGGEDGLRFYRYIASEWKKALNEGGYLVLEIGFDQGEEVKKILQDEGFLDVSCKKDLSGLDRVVLGHI